MKLIDGTGREVAAIITTHTANPNMSLVPWRM